MSSYTDQWVRIKALFERKLISPADLKALGKRHDEWFQRQGILDATPLMTNDLMVYANHLEEFGSQTA